MLTRRSGVLALAAIAVLVAACGGGGSGAIGSGSASTAASTTTTSVAVSATGPLRVAVAPFKLPAPVSREVVGTDGRRLVVLGGLDASKTSTGAVSDIDLSTGASRSFGTLTTPVHDAAGLLFNGRYLVFAGGASVAPLTRATVQAVGSGGGASQAVGSLPAPRADHVAAEVNGTVYVLGGGQEGAGNSVRLLPDVVASTDGSAWRPAGNLAAPVRYPAVAAVGGAIYLFGGVQSAGTPDSRAIQRYDPASGATTVVGQLPAPLSHATAVVLHGAVFLLGGFSNNVITAQVLRVLLPAATVAPVATLPAPVSDAAAISANDNGLLIGGQGATSAPVDTIVALSLGR